MLIFIIGESQESYQKPASVTCNTSSKISKLYFIIKFIIELVKNSSDTDIDFTKVG